ncbi:MAG: endonuclease [Flavobacteriaceae bacterium]|nr:endonuclease [Flavobacteriaceae bacterium]
MGKICTLFLFIFTISVGFSQPVLINELDADTPSTDLLEFIELKTPNPFSPLDGYVLVLFNGSTSGGDSSYYTMDLDGFVTDINGLFVLGAEALRPTPDYVIPLNLIQNGADAVAIYQGSFFDFPDGTLATTTNLIDALVYDTSDADDVNLMSLLGQTQQINENENGNQTTESIQRANDGSWFVAAPTPKMQNDGSGVILNGVEIVLNANLFNEGDTFNITLVTDFNVTEDVTFPFSFINGDFTNADFTGDAFVTILGGTNTGVTSITLLADGVTEEDEFMRIAHTGLPPEFFRVNDNVSVTVIDGDFGVSPWGTPLNPTFGNVQSTAPADYYDSIEGLSGVNLVQALQDLVAKPFVVRTHTYADIIDILKAADQNPENNNQVWLLYREEPRAKFLFQETSSGTGFWNREHVYPRSRGGFNSIQDDDIADGINFWWETNADSLRHANSDAHHLRAADANENSSRGNQFYGMGQYEGPSGNLGRFKGDVSRAILYMAIRYNGLDVVNGFPVAVGAFGDLATLLQWHLADPPDDFEMNRNNVIYTWQKNRNPFIDFPDMVDFIWGSRVGDIWVRPTMSLVDFEKNRFRVYPNPSDGKLFFAGIAGETAVQIFSISGQKVFEKTVFQDTDLDVNLRSGVYLVKTTGTSGTQIRKVVFR